MKLRICALALLLYTFSAFFSNADAALPAGEQNVLDTLYTQTAGASWYNKGNWENAGDPCAAAPDGWYGITCDATGSHVVALALPSNNLTGTLPALANLSALTSVDVSFNNLTGAIPALSALTNLQSFVAASNGLTNSLPALAGLTALSVFDVHTNQLSGAIPSLKGLVALTNFSAFDNQLSGSFPALGGLTNLQVFNLNTNQLSGTLAAWPSLPKLTDLEFGGNQFTGSLPSLNSLPLLTYFYARDNQLSGAIPNFTSSSQLATFDVGLNQFTALPTLTGLAKLLYLDVSFNQLKGSLPSFTGLNVLNGFYANNNQLTGGLPDLGNFLVFKTVFDVSVNQLSGAIPSLAATQIGDFFVNGNAFTGPAPAPPLASLYMGHSALCPNLLDHVQVPASANDLVWNSATASTPWSYSCGATTQMTLTATPNPVQAGSPVTLSVVVAPTTGSAVPTGTITVTDNVDSAVACTITVVAGSGSCSLQFLTAGPHVVTANYGGRASDLAGGSATLAVTVYGVTLFSSANPSVLGQSVVLSTYVTGATTPSGTATFRDGTTLLGTAPIANSRATFTSSAFAVGSHAISIAYTGDTKNAPANAALTQVVNKAGTTVTATVPSNATSGVPLTISAKVAAVSPGSGTPSGLITVSAGSTTCTITLAAGSGSCSLTPTTLGTLSLTLGYAGDPNFTASSATASSTVEAQLYGSLSVTTSVSGAPAGFSASFPVSVTCKLNAITQVGITPASTQNASAGTGAPGILTFANIAQGASCTISEGSLPAPPAGYAWNAAQLTQPSATIGATPIAATVSNSVNPPGFVALVPSRLLDTRANAVTSDGLFAATGALTAGAKLDLSTLARGGIPATDISAVVLNVTVTDPTAPGYITVWPAGTTQPNASNVNFVPGETRPNLVIAKLGTGGAVSLFNSAGTSHLVVDVVGYFITGADLISITPERLLDTRSNQSTIDNRFNGIGALTGLQQMLLTIGGRGGIPATGVGAVIMNVTATNPTAAGYVTVWPSDLGQPLASNLNFLPGQTVPNLVITKVGSTGSAALFNSAGNTDLIADVMGWFPSISQLTTLQPARILDTRLGANTLDGQFAGGGALAAQVPLKLSVTGRAGVPASGAGAVVLNVTVTNPTAAGYLTVWPSAAPRPLASNLNFIRGETIPNLVIAKLGADGAVTLFVSAGTTDVVVDVVGWFAGSP
jgi:Bacterial Ig-like domain (group 3)